MLQIHNINLCTPIQFCNYRINDLSKS